MDKSQRVIAAKKVLLESDLLSGRTNAGHAIDNALLAAAILVAPSAAETLAVDGTKEEAVANRVWDTSQALIAAGFDRKAQL